MHRFIARKHFGQSTEYWHFGPQDLRMSVKTVELCQLCHFSKSQLSQHIQGTKVQLPATLLRLEKKQPDFTTFLTPKKCGKKTLWHLKNRKKLGARWKTPVSGPWQCAKLDRRVRAAAWHQPLPVLPNKTFIIWHVQTDMWIKWNAFTLLIRFSCFHNLVSFLPSAVLHFRSFRAAQMFSHLFKAAKVYLQSGRLPEHRHGRMELQTGPYCHVISHFETRFHSTLPVACGYLVVCCNVS